MTQGLTVEPGQKTLTPPHAQHLHRRPVQTHCTCACGARFAVDAPRPPPADPPRTARGRRGRLRRRPTRGAYFARDAYLHNKAKFFLTGTDTMMADSMTKVVDRTKFFVCRNYMMNI